MIHYKLVAKANASVRFLQALNSIWKFLTDSDPQSFQKRHDKSKVNVSKDNVGFSSVDP